MNITITITKVINILFLVFGFILFLILSQNWRYRYYQWIGLRSVWAKKILFKKLIK